MALLSFRGISTPSLKAQGEQRRSSLFNIPRDNPPVSAILWFALNFFQAALLAVTPDRVPASRRAMASWVFGFAGPIGALIGINMCAFASLKGGYAVLAIFLVLATAVFVVLRARRPLCPECNDFAL